MIPLRAQLPSGINSYFTQAGLSFSNYIENIKKIVATARIDLTSTNYDTIVNANSPFEWRPANYNGKNAVLLIHGLLDAPFSMQDIGHFFYQRGFLVRSILLPGHGTVPGDLLDINHEEWIKASQYGIDSLQNEAKHIYFAGFSTGGSLAIYHALMRENLKALILFAPACKLNGGIAFANQLFGLTRWITSEDKWILRKSAGDYAKYDAFPMKAAWEVNALIQRIADLSDHHHVNMPMFMVLSRDDETIDTEAAKEFFKAQHHPDSQLLYYTNNITHFKDDRILTIPSHFPEQHILDFSHICLNISPDNSHYGVKGDYPEPIFELTKKDDPTVYRGAFKAKHLKQHYFQRLTYNPDYENMIKMLSGFLDSIR